MSLDEGAVVGCYRIVGKLGEGGMGTVYRAVDTMIQREVAIKALRPDIAAQPAVMDRFRSEAVLLAKLNHPAIAQLYAFFNEGGNFYMAMEYVAGDTFERVIQKGPMDWQRACAYMVQILGGIGHAHSEGILHRDLKPANVMLTPADKVKLMDFGIAQALGGARLTRVGSIIGTLEYLAPERIQGKPADVRSDLYSAGVMLFEMLSGRLPFQSEAEYDLLQMQIYQAPPALATLGVQVPAEVEAAVRTAMEKDPQNRYADAEEFSAALSALLPARKTGVRSVIIPPPPVAVPVVAAGAAAAAVAAIAPVPSGSSKINELMAKPVFWLASAGVLVLLAVGIVFAAIGVHRSDPVAIADTGTPIYHVPPQSSTTLPVNSTPVILVPSHKEPTQSPPPGAPETPPIRQPAPAPVRTVPQQTPPPEPVPAPVQPEQVAPPPVVAPPPAAVRSVRGPIVRLSDAQSIFVAGSQSDLDAIIRQEIMRQLGVRLKLAPTLASADVIMRVTMEAQTGSKVSKAERIFGIGRPQVRAVVFDARTSQVIWQQGAGDKRLIPGGDSLRRMAERIVKDMREAMGR